MATYRHPLLLTTAALLTCFAGRLAYAADHTALKAALQQALSVQDPARIKAAVDQARAALGEKAGTPEVADTYRAIPAQAPLLTAAEAQPGFAPHLARLQQQCWWKIGLDPKTIRQPLRAPASVLAGCVAALRAKLDGAEATRALARDAAEFLMWAQEQAGAGCFPFPASRGVTDNRAMEVADRFQRTAERSGQLSTIERNGWIFDDLDDGGLQFDNAECGTALLDYYELTGEPRALAAARRAADWAATRPLVTNWNYNSFSVWLLARVAMATGEQRYLESATSKALLGVLPGQLTDGPQAGRWLDPHNARPAYHYIMLRALAQLAAALPPSDARRAEVVRSLALGLTARNAELLSRGVMNKDKAMEALLTVQRVFATDAAFLQFTHTSAALHAVAQLVSAEARAGKLPLGPREWGNFLAWRAQAPGPAK